MKTSLRAAAVAILFAVSMLAQGPLSVRVRDLGGSAAPTGPCESGTRYTQTGNPPLQWVCSTALTWAQQVVVESLGAKLRRLAAAATVQSSPLTTPGAWAISTAYTPGTVVSNGGNLYICYSAGTSAGSGGPTGRGANAITDGSVVWYFYGINSTSILPAPAITNATSTPGGLTLAYNYSTAPTSFYMIGGTPINVAGSNWSFGAVDQSSTVAGNTGSGTIANQSAAVEFWTDAPIMSIRAYGDAPYSLWVNNVRVLYGGSKSTYTGGTGYTTIDFSASGGRLPRLIRMECGYNYQFQGVSVDPASKVWARAARDRVRVAFVGDSITTGANNIPMLPGDGWYVAAARALGWSDPWGQGVGGTGYINKGPSNLYYNFIERISSTTSVSPDVVVVFGGINDGSSSTGAITTAALTYFQALRTALPSTPIVVLGCYPAATGPSATALGVEAAIKSAFDTWADRRSYFIPVAADATGAWINGTGRVNSTTGTGNADVYISSDGTHPTQAGIDYFASRFVESARRIIEVLP